MDSLTFPSVKINQLVLVFGFLIFFYFASKILSKYLLFLLFIEYLGLGFFFLKGFDNIIENFGCFSSRFVSSLPTW